MPLAHGKLRSVRASNKYPTHIFPSFRHLLVANLCSNRKAVQDRQKGFLDAFRADYPSIQKLKTRALNFTCRGVDDAAAASGALLKGLKLFVNGDHILPAAVTIFSS